VLERRATCPDDFEPLTGIAEGLSLLMLPLGNDSFYLKLLSKEKGYFVIRTGMKT
jgi:hypothetical protein